MLQRQLGEDLILQHQAERLLQEALEVDREEHVRATFQGVGWQVSPLVEVPEDRVDGVHGLSGARRAAAVQGFGNPVHQ